MFNQMGQMTGAEKIGKYRKIKRVFAFLAAVTLWGISITFNVDGFNFIMPNKMWMGWTLGFIITIIELIWNSMKMKTNLTLVVLGMSAYAYGIYTNVVGVSSSTAMGNGWVSWIFPIILGIILEISPEPLLVWAIAPEQDDGDFLGNLFGIHPEVPKQRQKNNNPLNYRPGVPVMNNSRINRGNGHNRRLELERKPRSPEFDFERVRRMGEQEMREYEQSTDTGDV